MPLTFPSLGKVVAVPILFVKGALWGTIKALLATAGALLGATFRMCGGMLEPTVFEAQAGWGGRLLSGFFSKGGWLAGLDCLRLVGGFTDPNRIFLVSVAWELCLGFFVTAAGCTALGVSQSSLSRSEQSGSAKFEPECPGVATVFTGARSGDTSSCQEESPLDA